MKLNEIKKDWIETNKEWIEENKSDPIKVNMEYQIYLDSLCKDGWITQKQWQNANTTIIRRKKKC